MNHRNPFCKDQTIGAGSPIIIGGFYRSGTSLVRRILDAHSRIHCGPEVKFFRDFYGQYFQDTLKGIRFFTTVRTLGLDEKALLEILGRSFVKVHETAAQKHGKQRWADKNPDNVQFLEQWGALLNGSFRFVHCVRNPLDVFASVKENPFPLTIPAGMRERIELYRSFIENGLAFEKRNPEKSVRVRYEDLIDDPPVVLEKLATALGEKIEAGMLKLNSGKQQQGREDPKVRSTKGFQKDSIGKWRTVLSSDEIKMIVDNCKDIFEKLGYK